MRIKGEGYVPNQGKSLRIKKSEYVLKGGFSKYRGKEFDVTISAKDMDAAVKCRRGKAYAQKHYRAAAEKVELLRKSDMLRVDKLGLKTVSEQVACVLRRNPVTREDDGLLIAEVYHLFYHAKLSSIGTGQQQVTLDVSKLLKGVRKGGYPAPATIIRVRRHLQSLGYFQATVHTTRKRQKAREKYQKAFA